MIDLSTGPPAITAALQLAASGCVFEPHLVNQADVGRNQRLGCNNK